MLKYAKIINNKTGLCSIANGTNIEFYKTIGMTELDVQQSDIDGNYYLSNKCPMKTEGEKEAENQEVINHLVCTALDLATFIKQAGLTDTEIVQFLNANPSLQLQ